MKKLQFHISESLVLVVWAGLFANCYQPFAFADPAAPEPKAAVAKPLSPAPLSSLLNPQVGEIAKPGETAVLDGTEAEDLEILAESKPKGAGTEEVPRQPTSTALLLTPPVIAETPIVVSPVVPKAVPSSSPATPLATAPLLAEPVTVPAGVETDRASVLDSQALLPASQKKKKKKKKKEAPIAAVETVQAVGDVAAGGAGALLPPSPEPQHFIDLSQLEIEKLKPVENFSFEQIVSASNSAPDIAGEQEKKAKALEPEIWEEPKPITGPFGRMLKEADIPEIPKYAFIRKGATLNRYYLVRSGDTPASIAENIYQDKTMANDLVRWNALPWDPGQAIFYWSPKQNLDGFVKSFYDDMKIPSKKVQIKPGECLPTVAERVLNNKLSWRELALVNDLDDRDFCEVGFMLKVYGEISEGPKPASETPATLKSSVPKAASIPTSGTKEIDANFASPPVVEPSIPSADPSLVPEAKVAQPPTTAPADSGAPASAAIPAAASAAIRAPASADLPASAPEASVDSLPMIQSSAELPAQTAPIAQPAPQP